MDHNFEAQRRETYDTFRQSKGISLPKTSVVEYAFFIEVSGHAEESPLRDALDELNAFAGDVRVLGSFPVAVP